MIENFERQNSLNGSGIKRDKAGIPQEIPDHMMNAAVAARKNRKSAEIIEKTEDAEIKSPKKSKGKAPAPPESTKSDTKAEPEKNVNVKLNFTENLDEISPIEEEEPKPEKVDEQNTNKTEETIAELKENEKLPEDKEYCSDSDMENDNHSSVNTIELNSSDITIHHAETDTEMKNRKTASTGDLSKLHKAPKSNSGTLERAQSLDITDTGMPHTKKRKASKEDDELKSDSDDSFYEQTIKNKEPRLSLALDGLDTFQRNRLKKSTEWGNLEDAIMSLDKMEIEPPSDTKIEFKEATSPIKFDFGAKNTEFGTSITQIIDRTDENLDFTEKRTVEVLKDELNNITVENEEVNIVTVKNEIWPSLETLEKQEEIEENKSEKTSDSNVNISSYQLKIQNEEIIMENSEENIVENPIEVTKLEIKNDIWHQVESEPEPKIETVIIETKMKSDVKDIITEPEMKQENNISSTIITTEPSFSLKAQFEEKLNGKIKTSENTENNVEVNANLPNVNIKTKETSIFHPGKSSQNFIFAEKYASNNDSDYSFSNKLYDTNVSDDIKVSRHSLGSLERPKSDVLKSVNKLKMQNLISSDQGGISNITITEDKQTFENGIENETKDYDMSTASELYTTAIDSTAETKNEVSINQTNDIKNITITDTSFDNSLLNDSPSSLTIDTSSDGPDSIKSHTLTYVTEIQVSTPTNGTAKNISEIEVMSKPEVKKEEIFKRLPEMKFTTSSYETNNQVKPPEKRLSQIELLRSNFEKSPPKSKVIEPSPSKSRIPVAMSKVEVKGSPERKDIRIEHDANANENDKEVFEVMAHSTPIVSNQRFQNKNPTRNVTVTSIRTSSKIPSGSHIMNFTNKPPVPSKPSENHDSENRNGNSENFKQWVFNPGESSVTSIVVENKEHHK